MTDDNEIDTMTFTEAIMLWGKKRVRRVLELTKKYGILASQMIFSNGHKG